MLDAIYVDNENLMYRVEKISYRVPGLLRDFRCFFWLF